MKISSTTMMMFGVLALGGAGLYLYSKKQQPQLPPPGQTPAEQTSQFSQQSGITDPNMMDMMQQFYSMLGSGGGGMPKMSAEQKRLIEAQATSAYISAGAQGVAAIIGAIGSFF